MRACNCGETLRSSVQKNAAEINVAIKARLHFFELANVLIALRACDLSWSCARNFCRLVKAAVPQPQRLDLRVRTRATMLYAARKLIVPRLATAYSGLLIAR